MPLSRLQVQTLRCLSAVRLELDGGRNLIVGPNGAGKTSLLESIFVLGRGRSFRTRQTRRLVQRGADSLRVYGETGTGGRVQDRIAVVFRKGALDIRVNDSAAGGMADLAQALVVHVIDPSAHDLIEGSPSIRRRYLDAGVFHVEHGYLDVWRNYRRVLGQRNAALKAGAGGASLAVWSRQLLQAGAAIHAARAAYVADIGARIAAIGSRLLGKPIELDYRPGWRHGIDLGEALSESEQRDRVTGFTQVGPHRADIVIGLGGEKVREQASRGQQKLVAASFVLAEAGVLADRTEGRGILLVDDPAAELDAAALDRLLEELEGLAIQRVLTAISSAALPRDDTAVFHVEQGDVKAVV